MEYIGICLFIKFKLQVLEFIWRKDNGEQQVKFRSKKGKNILSVKKPLWCDIGLRAMPLW